MEQRDFSIVVPVYNSAKTLEELYVRMDKFFTKKQRSFEVIFVDDGSADNSWQVLSTLKKQSPQTITAVKLTQNYGQHNALFCGLTFVKGDWVITIDDDLQTPPEEIEKLLSTQENAGADLVYGYYEKKEHSFIRNLGSWFVEKTFKNFANTSGKGSSFKLINASVIEKVISRNYRMFFLDEILAWHTDNITHVVVNHLPRKEGKSGYTLFKLFKITLKLVVGYTAFPLKIISWFGLLSALICLGFVVYFIYMKYTYGAALGFTTLIVSIFFSTGLILFSLGIIGEYVRRLYIGETGKPSFTVKTVL
ncbi:MAG: glycosyltransferase family 2 protein [Bacteroidia bacterium]